MKYTFHIKFQVPHNSTDIKNDTMTFTWNVQAINNIVFFFFWKSFDLLVLKVFEK